MLKNHSLLAKLNFAIAATAALITGSVHADTIYGLTTAGQLFTADSATPSGASAPFAISGVTGTISSIDFQPSSGTLFGLAVTGGGTGGQLYTITTSGAATSYGPALVFGGPASTKYSIDFNPVANAVRIVGNGGGNYRLPTSSQIFATDTAINYNSADPNFDASGTFTPAVTSIAYTPNASGATTLYDYDFNFSNFATQGTLLGATSPNGGQLFSLNQTTGSSNLIAASDSVGFDIGASGSAFASAQATTGGASNLYSVNLTTGNATLVGAFGALNVRDFAVAVPEPGTYALFALGAASVLFASRRRRVASV